MFGTENKNYHRKMKNFMGKICCEFANCTLLRLVDERVSSKKNTLLDNSNRERSYECREDITEIYRDFTEQSLRSYC